jgi:hypothetical protein
MTRRFCFGTHAANFIFRIAHRCDILSSRPVNSWFFFTRNQQPKEETGYGFIRFDTWRS